MQNTVSTYIITKKKIALRIWNVPETMTYGDKFGLILCMQGAGGRGDVPPARPQRDLRGGGRLLPHVPPHRGRPQAVRLRQGRAPPDDLPRLAQPQVSL